MNRQLKYEYEQAEGRGNYDTLNLKEKPLVSDYGLHAECKIREHSSFTIFMLTILLKMNLDPKVIKIEYFTLKQT